jgi:chromosome segregation ATPase
MKRNDVDARNCVPIDEKLIDCRQKIKELEKENQSLWLQIEERDGVITDLKVVIDAKESKLRNLQQELENCAESGALTYDDLKTTGRLRKQVKVFKYFETFEQNDLFLEVLNWVDGTEDSNNEGHGMCENM